MTHRVLRVYHAARDPQHRCRERALVAAGIDVTLTAPAAWPEAGMETELSAEPFRVAELSVRRAGSVNRHAYSDAEAVRRLIDEVQPDLLDIHEEPFSVVAKQWLRAVPADVPVVMYSAQNVDKRFPFPFCYYEQSAHRHVDAFYPCSRQAASVLRGKGFGGGVSVLPLGYDDAVFQHGSQSLDCDEIILMFAGRLVPEKGVADAVATLAKVHAIRPARLIVSGRGPDESRAQALAASAGVADRVELLGWQTSRELAAAYRAAHVVLVPSRATDRWVEQFGRVIVEAQASGAVVAGYASGAIPEVAGDAGVVVPTGEVEQLIAGVVRVLSDPEEFAQRRAFGQRQAAARTWPEVASRQAALYHAVLTGERVRLKQPRSPRERRAVARAEFGPTASTTGGDRPFALPFLRRGGKVADAVARAVDATAELAARLPARA